MRSDGTEFMRASDAFTWLLEADPELRSTVVAVLWLDCVPEWDTLTARVDALSRQVDRMRQRVEEPPLRLSAPRWIYDDRFDLSWHLRRAATASPHTDASVLELARSEAMTGFDRTRPLWVFTLVEGVERGRAALIMKMHHALTDGQGATKLAPLLFDSVRHAARVPLPAIPEPTEVRRPIVTAGILHDWGQAIGFAGDGLRSVFPTSARALRNPVRGVRAAVNTARSIGSTVAPVTETMSPVMRGRGLSRTLKLITVDLADLKRAAKSADASVNDAFLASVAGGLRRYHELHASSVDKLRITMPISIRTDADSAASNRITLMRFAIPVSEPDPVARMRAINAESRKVRDAESLAYTNEIAFALDLLPTEVTGGALKHVDLLASNVVGTTKRMYLAGAQVISESVFGPTMGSAANLTLMSYVGECTIGINLDSAAVPDADAFVACLRWGFEEVGAVKGRFRR
jgi:diacylglycerol O-acyltransferase / wax synthase